MTLWVRPEGHRRDEIYRHWTGGRCCPCAQARRRGAPMITSWHYLPVCRSRHQDRQSDWPVQSVTARSNSVSSSILSRLLYPMTLIIYGGGSPRDRASKYTSPPPVLPGSTWWSGGLPCLPKSNWSSTQVNLKPIYHYLDVTNGIPSRSYGPRHPILANVARFCRRTLETGH